MTANTATADLERKLGKAIVDAVGRKDARRLLTAPAILQSAVAAAAAATAEALGAKRQGKRLPAGNEPGRALARAEAAKRLADFVLDGDWEELWPSDELLTTEEAARRLGKSQPTILEWIKKGRLVGLTRNKRGFRVPAEQVGAQGKILEGVAKVIALLPDHNTAWSFLTEPYRFNKRLIRPIDLLKKGAVDEVVAAAQGWGSDFL